MVDSFNADIWTPALVVGALLLVLVIVIPIIGYWLVYDKVSRLEKRIEKPAKTIDLDINGNNASQNRQVPRFSVSMRPSIQ